MKRALIALLLLAASSWAAPVTVEWDSNPPQEAVVDYCVQVNGAAQAPCVPGTVATVDAVAGDVLTVTARNALGESPPSSPVTVPAAASAPQGFRFKVTVTVEVQ